MPPSTTIIGLERHDSLVSVRDRLSWARTPRILLRWPAYEEVTLSLLDLKVLQRHARDLGAHLGIVTRRRNVMRDATALGIPVFQNPAEAHRVRWPGPAHRVVRAWRPPRKDLRALQRAAKPAQADWQANVGVRVAAFALGVAAVLALCAGTLPRADVIIYPAQGMQETVATREVFALVRGRTATSAASNLDGYLRPRFPSEITMHPSWWPWVPLGPFGVAVRIQ
jgi:hypothetical protein